MPINVLMFLAKQLKMAQSNINTMIALFLDVLKFSPIGLLMTLVLIFFKSISASIGLLLILPLLQVIGFSVGGSANNDVVMIITRMFNYIHLPLTLESILISYVILVSCIALAGYAEQHISTKLQQQYIHHLRTTVFKQLLYSKWPFFIKRSMPDLLHSLTGQVQTIGACNYQLLNLLNNSILVLIYTILAFVLSWQMTFIAIGCAFLLLSLMLPLHQQTSKSGQHHLHKNRAIFQAISEQLSALKMIKGSGFEENFINATLNISNSLEKQNQHLTTITAITKLVFSCSSVVIFSLLLYFAIKLLQLPLSELILLLVVFSRLLPKISMIQQSYQRLLHQLPSFCEVKALSRDCLANQEHLHHENASPLIFHNVINIKNLSFSYNHETTAPIFHNISMQIKKNEITALIGPSGVGKSTLADLIVGLLEPTDGQIFIDDQLLDRTNTLAWRKSVAYIPQNTFLFNASIRFNLQLYCHEQPDTVLWDALKQASAADFVLALEQGLDTIIGDRGVRLSGGECQRISLARALLLKPQLLVLDETTNALDSDTVTNIQGALTQLRGKITILIITHQTTMSDFADHKIVLDGTKVNSHQQALTHSEFI
jgi:ATP-binding cassette subfamily C protein